MAYMANAEDKAAVRLYQDGVLLLEKARFSQSTKIPVSPNPATFKITMDTAYPAWFPLATTTNTAWTFKSQRPANGKENLALLWPKYNFDLDAENKAHGGNTDHFDLSFVTQSNTTPNLRGVEVEVSTDDGKTWSKTKAESREDGHYKVWVKNPNSGFVSLRIKARDDKGSQIEQTLIKAYSVR
ncbi:hypothetical protein [Bacillus sp. AFS088145]|uniref:hypothetical protein n=1 Tax=Bacillus sp. AFS088145 TaxID=2033514 RepID=UPI001155C5F8|nr:hypothetical protein [Bacillus sp. AFS088145]